MLRNTKLFFYTYQTFLLLFFSSIFTEIHSICNTSFLTKYIYWKFFVILNKTFLHLFHNFSYLRGHSKSTIAQNSQVLTPLPLLLAVVHFRTPPSTPKLRSFWLELTLSFSTAIFVKFRKKKLMVSISIFG